MDYRKPGLNNKRSSESESEDRYEDVDYDQELQSDEETQDVNQWTTAPNRPRAESGSGNNPYLDDARVVLARGRFRAQQGPENDNSTGKWTPAQTRPRAGSGSGNNPCLDDGRIVLGRDRFEAQQGRANELIEASRRTQGQERAAQKENDTPQQSHRRHTI